MKDLDLTIHYQFATMDELPQEEQELIMAAIQATHNSYANYSHFHVGAALRLADGSIMIGANQENAAFPSSLCAERSAIFAAQSQKPEQAILTLAIAARNDQGMLRQPVTPCGGCRQVIMEMEERYRRPVSILLYGTEGIYRFQSVKDLLPFSFVDANMK